MRVAAKNLLTPEEYLAIERAAETKSEYCNGRMFDMAGAIRRHTLRVANATSLLRQALRGGRCEVYPADMRVNVSATGRHPYPDVVGARGDIRFLDEREDTLLNPTVIIGVLSDAMESLDRGAKFAHYRRLPSLREYLLISQKRMLVERYLRVEDREQWLLTEVSDAAASVSLPTLGCELPLSELYDRVLPSGSEAGEPLPLR
jgi:Uma2 family endonuclease